MSLDVEQVSYKVKSSERLRILLPEVEATAAVVAMVEPRARVYLYGSLSRKLLADKMRAERNRFSSYSDADVLIVLTSQIVTSIRLSKEMCC